MSTTETTHAEEVKVEIAEGFGPFDGMMGYDGNPMAIITAYRDDDGTACLDLVYNMGDTIEGDTLEKITGLIDLLELSVTAAKAGYARGVARQE